MLKSSCLVVSLLLLFDLTLAQQNSPYGIEVNPNSVEGVPVRAVVILLSKNSKSYLADSVETRNFYNAFGILPGATFRQSAADLAISTILKQPDIASAEYKVYNSEFGGPIVLVVTAVFLKAGELKTVGGWKGMAATGGLNSFPTILQNDHTKLTFILNGGVGLYNEKNALFSQGAAFTQGNSIATNPAEKGTRFWGEYYLEPGVAGITKIGRSNIYPYFSVSYLVSGRNTSDIYSKESTSFGAFERWYGGVLIPKIGKKNNISIDISAGRNFFQLNDGFLFSRYSGSANAGERGSVYLSSRTTYQMTVLAKVQVSKFTVDGFFLEPQELFKNSQSNTRFIGGTLNYNNNSRWDIGLSYISVLYSKAKYATPQGRIPMKGMFILNPKIWVSNIGGTGLFVKSEYALQSHSSENMQSNAYYAGVGLSKKSWRRSPSFYYRYAFMSGDNSNTPRYERFDAIQTGGLGNWVQGINFRKISGDGNIITHRVEVKGYINSKFELSLDYFYLKSHKLSNLGSLSPIAELKDKFYGHEVTATLRHFVGKNFLLLGVFSWAKPGEGVQKAFNEPVYNWLSLQGSVFMFF